jgi:nucleotide-binding universal stress UspA family protein
VIRKILVPVRGDGKGDNVFAHAAVLAKRFDAHIQVVHSHPKLEDLMPLGVVVPKFMRRQIEEAAEASAGSEETKLTDEFIALAEKFGLAITDQPTGAGKLTANFTEYAGKQADAVRQYGRLSDIICVPKPDRQLNLGTNTLQSALYSSGRPVMMCPPRDDVPATLGENIAIGWNGSLEATRAIAMTTSLVESAGKVTILTTGNQGHATSATDLAQYLSVRGVTAEVNHFEKDKTIGRDLLRHSAGAGADLLIMGAYHDSYERETLFGGNTQVVVDEATVPVIFVH